jgi:hypothetical protein
LVVDRTVVCDGPINECVLILLSAFYAFNIGYPKGFTLFLQYWMCYYFRLKKNKVDPKVQLILRFS